MSFLVGLDIGTSAVKSGLFDLQGNLLASARSPQPCYAPQAGWAEQEPRDWWEGSLLTLKQVLQGVDSQKIAAVGLSAQCPGHILLDERHEPLGRAIIWRDQRAVKEAAWIQEHIAESDLLRWTGMSQFAEPTMTPPRLLWLKRQRSEDWQKTTAVVQPKDFIGLRLTGELATDPQTAFGLLDPQAEAYQHDFLAALDISPSLLPPLRQPTAALGKITPQIADLTGLRAGIPVIVGTIDAYCDSLAGGVVQPGRAVDVAGTSEIISLGIAREASGHGVFLARIGSLSCFLCGPSQAGGDTLRWLAGSMYPNLEMPDALQELEKEASAVAAGSGGLIFAPYLNGERAPLWDAQARGIIFGLTQSHNRRHWARAAYEGVAYAARHILEACEEAAGLKADQIVVCGGASTSRFWNQVKADIFQRPLSPARVSESGCLGAAILAAVGAGLYPGLSTACQEMVRLGKTFTPEPEAAEACQANYEKYRMLYPALQPVFHFSGRQTI